MRMRPGDLVISKDYSTFLWAEPGARGEQLRGELTLHEPNKLVVGLVIAIIKDNFEEYKMYVATPDGSGWTFDEYFSKIDS